MPTSRWFVKRDLDQALVHLARMQNYLVRSGALYEAEYPEHYKAFCLLVVLCEQLEQGITGVKNSI